jgi:hypothetical protein
MLRYGITNRIGIDFLRFPGPLLPGIREIENRDLPMELIGRERRVPRSSKNQEYPAALQSGRAFIFLLEGR